MRFLASLSLPLVLFEVCFPWKSQNKKFKEIKTLELSQKLKVLQSFVPFWIFVSSPAPQRSGIWLFTLFIYLFNLTGTCFRACFFFCSSKTSLSPWKVPVVGWSDLRPCSHFALTSVWGSTIPVRAQYRNTYATIPTWFGASVSASVSSDSLLLYQSQEQLLIVCVHHDCWKYTYFETNWNLSLKSCYHLLILVYYWGNNNLKGN